MASTYMDNYRAKCRDERDQKIRNEETKCNQDVYALERKILPHKEGRFFVKKSGLISFAIWIVLGAISQDGLLGFTVGLISWPILVFVLKQSKNSAIDQENNNIARRIDERKRKCLTQCKAYEAECDQKIAAEVSRYKQLVAKTRKTYGGSTVTGPIVKWMCKEFDTKIRAADRGIYIAEITAPLMYRVDQHQIVLLEKLPHSGTLSESKKLVFNIGIDGRRFHDLPDMFHQIGFAQALAKQIEFEILSSFSRDPISPAKECKPKITIEYDDSNITVTYRVGNPNYRARIGLGKGAGS